MKGSESGSVQESRAIDASRRWFGRRYRLPRAVAAAIEHIFEESVDRVVVIEHSRYAKFHRGMTATTRPNRIFLAISGREFTADPRLLLHEYYHVLCQWGPRYLTRWRYIAESIRCGYLANRYEQEAREFAAGAVERYVEILGEQYEA